MNEYSKVSIKYAVEQGRRILVLHSDQGQQCSSCLGKSSICPANGNGKLRTEMKTPRAKMSSYMKEKSLNIGYINLRTQTGFGLPK